MEDDEKPCSSTQDCENTPGAYTCACKPGYKLVDDDCQLIREQTDYFLNRHQPRRVPLRAVSLSHPLCMLTAASDDICGCGANGTCDSVSGRCHCDDGYVASTGDGEPKCRDVDECHMPKACHPLATCVNTDGGECAVKMTRGPRIDREHRELLVVDGGCTDTSLWLLVVVALSCGCWFQATAALVNAGFRLPLLV